MDPGWWDPHPVPSVVPMHPLLPHSCGLPAIDLVCLGPCRSPTSQNSSNTLPTHWSLSETWAKPGSSPFWVVHSYPGWPQCLGKGKAKGSCTQKLCQPCPSHWCWETTLESLQVCTHWTINWSLLLITAFYGTYLCFPGGVNQFSLPQPSGEGREVQRVWGEPGPGCAKPSCLPSRH